MVTSFGIGIKVTFELVGKEKDLEDGKHDEELNNHYKPQLLPNSHIGKSFPIKEV